jgi:glycosyltransferase 2 family protein
MLSRLSAFIVSPVGRVLRGLLSLLLIGWLLHLLDWHALQNLDHARVAWPEALAGLLLALLAYPVCAWRWQKLLGAHGVRLPVGSAHAIVWIGQFYNAFLPGGIGGDAARLAHAFALAPDQKRAVTVATVLDRLIGFTVLLALALPAAALFNATDAAQIVTLHIGFWLLGAIGVVSLLALFFLPKLPAWLPTALTTWNEQWTAIRTHRSELLLAATASMAVWILDFVSAWLLARSVGLSLDFMAVSLALIIAYLSTLLPISLGGHGLRESSLLITVALLSSLPIDDSQLASFTVLFLAVTLSGSLTGGVVMLGRSLAPQKKTAPKAAPQDAESIIATRPPVP